VSGTQSPIDAYAYLYDPAGNRTTEQINASVSTSAYNTLNQMNSRTGGGLLTISGSVSQPSVMTIGSGAPFVTGSTSTSTNFSAQVPVVTGSNNIQISATNVNGYGVTQTLGVNVTSGTPISSLTYDLNGNLTNDGTQTYKWDSANRLIEVDEPAGAVSRFLYDGLGRRVQIADTGTNGVVTTKNLVWDGMTICEEKNASDTVTKSYFAQGVQLSGGNYYYTRDHLGSIRELTDVNANVEAEYSYDPYGRQTETSGTMSADFGFTGQYYDQPSGLLLAPYRGYSAALGRWISRDPLGERGGINLYGYVGNEPVNRTDPTGLVYFAGNTMPNKCRPWNNSDTAALLGLGLTPIATIEIGGLLLGAGADAAATGIADSLPDLGAGSRSQIGENTYEWVPDMDPVGPDEAPPSSPPDPGRGPLGPPPPEGAGPGRCPLGPDGADPNPPPGQGPYWRN
jgi:RHS repeat-associated protein